MATLDANNTSVLTTEKIKEIERKENYGEKLGKNERIWFKNQRGLRKPFVTFAMTRAEMEEYAKCKFSVQYFAQKYCQIKREDGSIGSITLRDYQKEILDIYDRNRFSILMCSRQMGKCYLADTQVVTKNGLTSEISNCYVFDLYFELLREQRPLKLTERLKWFLYKVYSKL